MRQAFQYLDCSKRGKISEKDLQKMAEEIGESTGECSRMVSEADKDQDGFISEEELLRAIKKTSYF